MSGFLIIENSTIMMIPAHALKTPMPPVIGLLGGSFNPAHEGHIHISEAAMRQLGIDTVWWMVSPQNPLKSTKDMTDFKTRLEHAKKLASGDKRIVVTDIEQRLHSQYTARTLDKLQKRFPHTKFIWIMGADNLASIHRWQHWQHIFKKVPILVLDRAPLSHKALHAKAAIRFKKQRLNIRDALFLANISPPIWSFSHIKKHPESATNLRKKLGDKAFLV